MAYYLKVAAGDYIDLSTLLSFDYTAWNTVLFEFEITDPDPAASGGLSQINIFGRDNGNPSLHIRIDTGQAGFAGGGLATIGALSSNQKYVFEARRVINDTWEFYLDDVLVGQPTDSSFTNTFMHRLVQSTNCEFNVYRLEFYNSSDVLTHDYDPTAANGTGSTLPDSAGTNDGTLVGFPTDDSQWVSYSSASLTITQTELTPGGTISGSYSNYATVPTTLTVSDGTNTITIASPTIADNGDGTGTFSGTMPSLPTSGTANLILFGNVTVELS